MTVATKSKVKRNRKPARRMYINPVTNEHYYDLTHYIDSLGTSYRNLLIQKGLLADEEAKIIEAIDTAAGQPEVKIGTLNVFGDTFILKVVRRINTTYKKLGRGLPHPIVELMKKHIILKDMVRTEIKESGSVIERMMEQYHEDPSNLSTPERRLCAELESIRTTSPGKPGIEVVERTK